MYENLIRMKHAITEWAIKDNLLDDARFYSKEEWNSRGEHMHNDSLLVLTIDSSGLYNLLNFGGDTEEFDDLVESFGFSYEMGYQWSLGFYPIDNYQYKRIEGNYTQKLRDGRWKKKSEAVKKRANYRCQDCRIKAPLDAHHCYYTNMRDGYEPWEYPLSALRALCRQCHKERPIQEIRMRALVAQLTQNQLKNLIDGLDNVFNRFETESFLSFMNEVSFHDHLMKSAISKLKKNRDIYDD
ncbi:HNH endonuclease [Aeromonas caviae]|uniref:HNH endonuclease n=1 Tax=Aeromonas caviae TaxID=648 RepID=UPI0038CFC604